MRPKKPSLQDTMEGNAKAMRGLCALAGKPMPPELEAPVRVVKATRAAPVKSDIPTEHEEQKNFVKWFRAGYPKVLIFAVPNAGQRDHNAASWMRAEGLVAGVPDLIVPAWTLGIEFKRIKGSTISEEQYWMESYFKGIGWNHFFAYGAEDAKLKLMGIPK